MPEAIKAFAGSHARPDPDNLIFFDTEFSTLDPYHGEILSIGLVKPGGETLYLELEHDGDCHPWVTTHILPMLTGPTVSRPDACARITAFVGPSRPYAVAYVNQFDTLFMHKLFGVNKWPFYWLPLDFASILFARGINPEDYGRQRPDFFQPLGLDPGAYKLHHALDDARLLRDTWYALAA